MICQKTKRAGLRDTLIEQNLNNRNISNPCNVSVILVANLLPHAKSDTRDGPRILLFWFGQFLF